MATRTTPPRAGVVTIGDISLRERENGLLAGGTQVGKSTLADELWADFLWRYRARKARVHISDTKPRYRAEWLPNGLPAKGRYKNWDHGPTVPGSVLVESPRDMDLAWSNGYRVTIGSSDGTWEPKQDECIAHFHNQARRTRPQLLVVDETKDHFHGNGMARGNGALIRVARAGNERGEGGLYCTQRTAGISQDLMEMMRRLYAFRLDNKKDAKRFQEFGAPEFPLPTVEYQFRYWWKGDYHRVWGPYRTTLPGRS
jgi:hypothetical protein